MESRQFTFDLGKPLLATPVLGAHGEDVFFQRLYQDAVAVAVILVFSDAQLTVLEPQAASERKQRGWADPWPYGSSMA